MTKLSFLHRGLTPELVKRAEDELGETEETRTLGIKELKRLIKEEPDFNPCTEDAFLTRFLRARKYDLDRAFKTLKNYYMFKAQNSGVVTDLKPSDILSKLDGLQVSVLEHRCDDQSIVGYIRLGKLDDKLSPDELLAIIIFAAEVGLQSEATHVAGYSLVVDLTDFGLLKAKRFSSPSFLYKAVSAYQDCWPSRIKAFHFLNGPFYIDAVVAIMRRFMSEKLNKRFHIHKSNLDTLHEHLNPKFIPEELGGDQGPAKFNEKKFFDILCEHEDYFVRMNKFGYTGDTLQKLRKEKKNTDFN